MQRTKYTNPPIDRNIALIKTKHVKTYNSFVPKTIRDWKKHCADFSQTDFFSD